MQVDYDRIKRLKRAEKDLSLKVNNEEEDPSSGRNQLLELQRKEGKKAKIEESKKAKEKEPEPEQVCGCC